jgi:hypothetical protein
MNIFINNRIIVSIFGILAFAFFAFLYPFHLNYQEQYQLFLFTGDYFALFFQKPGGLSDYLGNFLTQFYFYSWVGAIILAVLLMSMQQLVWIIARKLGASKQLLPLSFVPSVLYWGLLCDENYLLGGLIAIIIPLLFVVGYQFIQASSIRQAVVLIVLPIIYWVCGGSFLLLAVFIITNELSRKTTFNPRLIGFIAGIIGVSVLSPVLSKYYLLQYPTIKAWIGVNYYRFPTEIPLLIVILLILASTLPFLLKWISTLVANKKRPMLPLFQILLVAIGGSCFIYSAVDMAKEEVMGYDFNVRMRKWDRVIEMAEKKAPSSPLSVTCLNLALAKQDLLGERMFHYYQNGVNGLIPDFIRDYTIPFISGEVYYHLGFINTAQRYAFEAMEALPDYQKSSRALMRLAETNIINRNYAVATKYLHLLQNTFYYRKWATNAIATLQDEKLIEQHPEWGWLRQCRIDDDFLFSEGEKDMMLGLIYQHFPQNQMAFEYQMAYCLLNNDLIHFEQYFPMNQSIKNNRIPTGYQEALIFIWSIKNHHPIQTVPYPIGNAVKERFIQFGNIYKSSTNAKIELNKKFSDTYWYYLQFRK